MNQLIPLNKHGVGCFMDAYRNERMLHMGISAALLLVCFIVTQII